MSLIWSVLGKSASNFNGFLGLKNESQLRKTVPANAPEPSKHSAATRGISNRETKGKLKTKPQQLAKKVQLAFALLTAMTVLVGGFEYWRFHHAQQAAAAKEVEEKRLAEEKAKAAIVKGEELQRQQSEERQRQQKVDEEARVRRQEEQRVADLKSYKARYLGIQPVHRDIAVLIVDENGKPNLLVSNALVKSLNDKGFKSTATLFSSAFATDGLFAEVFGGAKAPIDKLELPALADTLLLGRQSVDYAANAALDNLVTANMTLKLVTVPLNNGTQEFAKELQTVGAELDKRDAARSVAEERLIQKLPDIAGDVAAAIKAATGPH